MSKARNIRYKYCRQFIIMLTASEQMEHNQSTIAAQSLTRHMDQILQPFLTFLSVAEKAGRLGSWRRSLVAAAVVDRFK